ncbi:hypothetical protein D3C76_1398610 [compost metagenome]
MSAMAYIIEWLLIRVNDIVTFKQFSLQIRMVNIHSSINNRNDDIIASFCQLPASICLDYG